MLIDLEAELKLLKPTDIKLRQDRKDGLTLDMGETSHPGIKATLLFPLTGRQEFIRLSDSENVELGIVRSLEALDQGSQEALNTELSKAYFIPQVTKIDKIREEYGTWHWDVATDSGNRHFEVRDRKDVRFLDSKHVVIRDVDGNRYEILNLQNLDDESLHMLETEL